MKPLTWALEEEMKIMGLSNHQWPEEEDEGSAGQKKFLIMSQKLKGQGTCKRTICFEHNGPYNEHLIIFSWWFYWSRSNGLYRWRSVIGSVTTWSVHKLVYCKTRNTVKMMNLTLCYSSWIMICIISDIAALMNLLTFGITILA